MLSDDQFFAFENSGRTPADRVRDYDELARKVTHHIKQKPYGKGLDDLSIYAAAMAAVGDAAEAYKGSRDGFFPFAWRRTFQATRKFARDEAGLGTWARTTKPLDGNEVVGEETELLLARVVHSLITCIDEREREIISARYLSSPRATREELAAKLGVSQQRVAQLEDRAFEKLKGYCSEWEWAQIIPANDGRAIYLAEIIDALAKRRRSKLRIVDPLWHPEECKDDATGETTRK